MDFNYHIFSLSFILTGIITAVLAALVLRRRGEVVRIFGILMILIAIWTTAYGFELASTSLRQMLFWIRVEYIGIAFLPALWLLFILKFSGREKYISPLTIALLLLEPLMVYAMVLSMDYHQLHYQSTALDNSGPFPLLSIEPGLFYIIHTIYFYSLLALGLFLLMLRFGSTYRKYRQHTSIILLAAVVPWLVNLLYILGFRPFNHIDLTPIAFAFTAFIIGIGLLRFRLFDLVPVAREKLIEAMQDGVLVINNYQFIVDVNRKMQNLLGLSRQTVIGHSLDMIFPLQHPVLKIAEEKLDRELWEHHNPETQTTETFQICAHPLYEGNKTPFSGKLIIFRDVTEYVTVNKKLELQAEELLKINSLKDKLFSIIAHDLRGPLASLSEILRLSEKDMLSEEELRGMLPLLSKNLGYTSGLVENLLSWAKSQLQGEKVHPLVFDLREVIRDKISLLEKSARNKGVSIHNTLMVECLVYADRNMIELVVRNLLSNAIKFSNEGDKVIISAYQEKEQCTLSIKDTGIGIKAEDRHKLFGLETFSTLGTGSESGTGLGLTLCKDFVEKNGGTIWLNSKYADGSEFIFTLPGGNVLLDDKPGILRDAARKIDEKLIEN